MCYTLWYVLPGIDYHDITSPDWFILRIQVHSIPHSFASFHTPHIEPVDHLQIDHLQIDHLDPNLPLSTVVQDLYTVLSCSTTLARNISTIWTLARTSNVSYITGQSVQIHAGCLWSRYMQIVRVPPGNMTLRVHQINIRGCHSK